MIGMGELSTAFSWILTCLKANVRIANNFSACWLVLNDP